nr:hypothetical protein Iba_chr13aCG10270 [Ipomoea batatas]GMD79783.1 hypothetical protein Iba_chr13dCG7270 [Ipomoea batatas]GMD81043.1 hypothetical protein Iba_chr13eCG7760 [Ipomoea batatas]
MTKVHTDLGFFEEMSQLLPTSLENSLPSFGSLPACLSFSCFLFKPDFLASNSSLLMIGGPASKPVPKLARSLCGGTKGNMQPCPPKGSCGII